MYLYRKLNYYITIEQKIDRVIYTSHVETYAQHACSIAVYHNRGYVHVPQTGYMYPKRGTCTTNWVHVPQTGYMYHKRGTCTTNGVHMYPKRGTSAISGGT